MDLDRILFENKREVTTKDVAKLLEFLEKEKKKKHFKENSEEFKRGYNDVIETICAFFEDQLYFYKDESLLERALGLGWWKARRPIYNLLKSKNSWFWDIIILSALIILISVLSSI